MSKSLIAAAVAATAFCVMPFAASAVPTITVLASSTQGAGNTADVYGADFNGSTPLGATWDGAAPVVTPPPGNANGSYQSPFNNTGLVDTQSYFSVGGSNGGNGGPSPMTLTFDTLQDNFTLLWGSIDSYNSIEFFDANGVSVGGSTGTDIANDQLGLGGGGIGVGVGLGGGIGLGGLGGLGAGLGVNIGLGDGDAEGPNFEQVALLEYVFGADEMFKSVTFTSTSAAFEFALPAAVPLPAAAWMLISAIAGLGFVSRRRRAAAA